MQRAHSDWRPGRGHPRRPARCRWFGFTVLELLVVLAVIGLVVGLLLPAVMHARETSRRFTCVSHLRQLGVAVHHRHEIDGRLPPAWRAAEEDPNFAYGWAVFLASQLELKYWSDRVDMHRRPDFLSTPQQAEELAAPLLVCPSDIIRPSFALFQGTEEEHEHAMRAGRAAGAPLVSLPTANYVGVYGTHEPDEFAAQKELPVREFADGTIVNQPVIRLRDLRRGTSHTLMVGERQMATVPSTWVGVDRRGLDAGCRLAGAAITSPNCRECDECEFTSRHAGGVNFLWADGHVSLLSSSIDQAVYRQQAQRNLH